MSDINFATSTDERRREYFSHGKHTNGFDFQLYRNEIMTEDERELGQKIVQNFQESYRAKERAGVFHDMAIAESYWSGEWNNKTDDMLSNVNIINPNVESQVADLMDQNIDIEPRPYDPSDAPYVPRVRRIAEKILAENHMPMKIQKITRRFKKFGHGWIRVLFNPELLEGMGCPEIESISSADIYPDPAVINIEDINKGRYFIEAKPMTIAWAEKTFGMKKACAIYPGYKPYSDNRLNDMFSSDIDTSGENYLHIMYWCKYTDKAGKEKLRLIQCSGCGIILKDSMNYEEKKGIAVFPDTKEVRYPYWETVDMERENTIWGKSNCSLLYPLQDEADEIGNSIIANARLTGNPQKYVTVASGIDPEKIDNTEGQVIITNTADGFGYITPPSMPAYIINRRQDIMNTERAIVSRVSDQNAGIKQHGVDTATESLALQQNANKATDATKTVLQEILAQVFMYCIELAIEYWDEGMFFGDDKDNFEYFVPSELKEIPMLEPVNDTFRKAFEAEHPNTKVPDYMEKTKNGKPQKRKIHVLMTVSVGAGIPKNKALMYNVINETFNKGAMSPFKYRENMEEYIGLPFDEEEQMTTQGNPSQGNVAQGNVDASQTPNVLEGGVNPQALDRLQAQRR